MRTMIWSTDPGYVEPAPDEAKDLCDSKYDGYFCTLRANHEGQHVAHIYSERLIVEVWD